MYLKKLIFIICSLLFLNFGDNEICFNHKKVDKEVKKTFIGNEITLHPMILPDSIKNTSFIRGKYFSVNNTSDTLGYAYIGRVNCCRANGCSINNVAQENREYEYFDYLVLYDLNCTIKQLKVFNYQATHGQEVTAKNWLKQFIAYNGVDELQVGKNIDGITGATISVHAITYDVESKSKILKQIKP